MEIILNILIYLPLLGAISMLFLPRFLGNDIAKDKYRWIALFATGFQLILTLYFYFFLFDPAIQLGEATDIYQPHNWIDHFNIKKEI